MLCLPTPSGPSVHHVCSCNPCPAHLQVHKSRLGEGEADSPPIARILESTRVNCHRARPQDHFFEGAQGLRGLWRPPRFPGLQRCQLNGPSRSVAVLKDCLRGEGRGVERAPLHGNTTHRGCSMCTCDVLALHMQLPQAVPKAAPLGYPRGCPTRLFPKQSPTVIPRKPHSTFHGLPCPLALRHILRFCPS